MRLLIIEDSADLVATLANGFRGMGHGVDALMDGAEGWAMACEGRHDCIILDRKLPGLDGIEILRRLRQAGSQVPVMLLTARDAVADRVEGLEAGADDYLVKPFALVELVARVGTLLRRGRHQGDPISTYADLEVDAGNRTARRGGRRIDLSPREFQILKLLMDRRGDVLSRSDIHAHIVPGTARPGSNLIEVLIARLRRKLHGPGLKPMLHTCRGLGYQLAIES